MSTHSGAPAIRTLIKTTEELIPSLSSFSLSLNPSSPLLPLSDEDRPLQPGTSRRPLEPRQEPAHLLRLERRSSPGCSRRVEKFESVLSGYRLARPMWSIEAMDFLCFSFVALWTRLSPELDVMLLRGQARPGVSFCVISRRISPWPILE
jgi:hypothetical protein